MTQRTFWRTLPKALSTAGAVLICAAVAILVAVDPHHGAALIWAMLGQGMLGACLVTVAYSICEFRDGLLGLYPPRYSDDRS